MTGSGGVDEQQATVLGGADPCLSSAGAAIEDVVKWTILVVDEHPVAEGFQAFGEVWRQRPDPPAITVAVVARLAVPGALVEIEAVAAVPR
ncbi:MAG: RidA family protein [Pseudonocardia sp.]